jgi:rhodanese-related sulfurtransferase
MQSFLELIAHYWLEGLVLVGIIVFFAIKKLSKFFGGEAIEVTAKQAIELIEQQEAILIDLAEKTVFEKGHILGAVSMPGITFINGSARLEDVSKPIILLPMKGLFPMPVVQFIYSVGVTKLYLFKGSLNEWKKEVRHSH